MPRRQFFESGHYYHIYNRGNNRGAIFFKPENYIFFLRRWKKYLTPYLDTVAYTLMPTHYHVLVRVKNPGFFEELGFSEPTPAISNAMQRFGLSYTKAINKSFERVGSLFQGVYQAKLIQTETHLLHLCRYIHGNPVKDGLVADPADWQYSNYLEWIGERDGTLFNPEFVRTYFSVPEDYRQFVRDDLLGRDLPEDIRLYLESLDK